MLLFIYALSLFIIDLIQLTWRSFLATIWTIYHMIIRPAKKPLNGEIILVTGAAHGIGRELALEFGKRGGHLVLWDVNEDGLKQTVIDIQRANGKASYYTCDVTDRDVVKQTALKVCDEVGNVTILVNNAGIFHSKSFEEMTYENIRKTIEVNVMAHFWTIQEFLPKMIEMNHGHIVAMSSICGKLSSYNILPYSTSKFAVTGMMEALSEELRYYKNTDINFTTAYPFVINTGLCKHPKIKYPWFNPITEPDVAAQKIIDAVQRNAEHVYIPFYYEYFARLSPLLPRKVYKLVIDFIDAGCNPQSD